MTNIQAILHTQPPHRLDNLTVNRLISKGTVGVYILSKLVSGTLCPYYVGRSDTCLRRRLTTHPHKKLGFFHFIECETVKRAYLLERLLFLTLRPPLNIAFPNQPRIDKSADLPLSAIKLSKGQTSIFSFIS